MMKYLIILFLATNIYSGVIAQDYEKLRAVFEKSYALEKDSLYQESLNVLKDFYQANSYDFNIRYGWLYYNLGDYPKSKEYYKKAMDILPYSHEAKFGYVLPLAGLGEWDNIIGIYNSMLKIDPKNTIVLYRLGAIYYDRKDYQKAYDYLEEVINLYPNDYYTNLLIAWTYYRMAKLKEAKVLFNKVLLIKPDDPSATEGLSLIH